MKFFLLLGDPVLEFFLKGVVSFGKFVLLDISILSSSARGGCEWWGQFHLVEWAKLCSPIDECGLGIRNVRRFNQALLGKWLWRFAHEKGARWRSILMAKYGSVWGCWRSRVIFDSHGVGLWKFICMGWQSFQSHFRFNPSEGSKVRFWDDVWCGDSPLKVAFLGLFNIASFKKASIADNVEQSNGILSLRGWFMIMRWRFWLLFMGACILVRWERMKKTSCGGCLRARGFLRSSLSTEFSQPWASFLSLEEHMEI